jgi:hypothetical protein
VKLHKLGGGAGYIVAAKLSRPWPYDCTAVSTDDPPELAWSRDPQRSRPDDAFNGALVRWDGDARARTCHATSWRSPADLAFGDPEGIQPGGKWYFQVALSCPLDGTEPECVTGMTYTNVVRLKIARAPRSGGQR